MGKILKVQVGFLASILSILLTVSFNSCTNDEAELLNEQNQIGKYDMQQKYYLQFQELWKYTTFENNYLQLNLPDSILTSIPAWHIDEYNLILERSKSSFTEFPIEGFTKYGTKNYDHVPVGGVTTIYCGWNYLHVLISNEDLGRLSILMGAGGAAVSCGGQVQIAGLLFLAMSVLATAAHEYPHGIVLMYDRIPNTTTFFLVAVAHQSYNVDPR